MLDLSECDHRAIGRRLDLFHIEDHSPGMVFWHPRGVSIYRAIEDFIRAGMARAGYEEVRSPQLLSRELWERSGHWEKFGAAMFSVKRKDGRDMALKPMSCPCHLEIFNAGLRSWRDLPMRLCEFGQCHRNEPSGSMHGLMRSRGFEQDDAHVICRPDQVADEVARFVALVREVYAAFGFDAFEVSLSLRPDLRAGSDEEWDRSEAALLEAARSAGMDPVCVPGEGAFYGPKLEFALRDSQGRSWQCGTAQLDSVLPGRLGARYVDENGDRVVPVMIHHAVLGSIGRFIGILLEEHGVNLPSWIAPIQVSILPVGADHEVAAEAVRRDLASAGIRAEIQGAGETVGRRMVELRRRGVPFRIVLGEREISLGKVSIEGLGRKVDAEMPAIAARLVDLVAPPDPGQGREEAGVR